VACDAPVAGGGGRPPARAEALDHGRPTGGRDGEEVLMWAVDRRGGRLTPTGENRAQQALHEGEERSDPGAREGHQSAAS
jgi:hypothetical protein